MIPLRRRATGRSPEPRDETSPTAGKIEPGIWDPDAPPAGLTPRPSIWRRGNQLLASAAPAGGGLDPDDREISARPPRLVRKPPLVQMGAALVVLALTAVVLAIAAAGSNPHMTRLKQSARCNARRRPARTPDARPRQPP